jgi:hypothetical protein
MFCCAGTDSVDLCPKAQPWEQRDPTLYTLASKLQKQEARFNPYAVACNSIGYFTPQCYVNFFMFRFFKFYLPAMPPPPPCYIIRTQTCLFPFSPSSLLNISY